MTITGIVVDTISDDHTTAGMTIDRTGILPDRMAVPTTIAPITTIIRGGSIFLAANKVGEEHELLVLSRKAWHSYTLRRGHPTMSF